MLNLFIPLFMGGLFCVAVLNGYVGAVAPATLLFYGMALYNAGKYTYRDIRYLGVCEMVLGSLPCYLWVEGCISGLWFWCAAHRVRVTMYIKYDRS